MTLDEFQALTLETAHYPDAGEGYIDELTFLALGLNGEAGEVAEVVKKMLRGDNDVLWMRELMTRPSMLKNQELLAGELGDTFYYLARLAAAAQLSLEDVAEANIEKVRRLKAEREAGREGGQS